MLLGVLESSTGVSQFIFADQRSREALPFYSGDYFGRFYSQAGSIAMREITAAAHDIGSYWNSAWLNAGRPAVPGR